MVRVMLQGLKISSLDRAVGGKKARFKSLHSELLLWFFFPTREQVTKQKYSGEQGLESRSSLPADCPSYETTAWPLLLMVQMP